MSLREQQSSTTYVSADFLEEDYFSAEIIEARSLFMRYARAVINATGEPWRFGIDNTPPVKERVAAFLESCGLALEEQRNFGPEKDGKRAMAGFPTRIVSDAGKPLASQIA